MTLPVTATRFQPALAVIQSATYARERAAFEDARGAGIGLPLVGQPTPPKDMQAINEHYFGVSLTPMEAMFAMVERAVDYLNHKLGVGRDGDPKAVEEGNAWREQALIKNVGVGSDEDFSIPKPGENGATFRSVAKLVLEKFKSEFLAADSDLRKLLEDTVGFRLDGMNAAELFEAFAEPEGDTAKKVYDVVSEGLAGQAGSKVSQRLEQAASGTKSVEETVADQGKSSIDVVDEETLAEDLKAVEAAKAREKLEAAAAVPEKIREAMEEARPGKGGSNADESQAAVAIVQALSGLSDAVRANPDSLSDASSSIELELNPAAADEADEQASRPGVVAGEALRGVLAHYLEFIGEPDFGQEERNSIWL